MCVQAAGQGPRLDTALMLRLQGSKQAGRGQEAVTHSSWHSEASSCFCRKQNTYQGCQSRYAVLAEEGQGMLRGSPEHPVGPASEVGILHQSNVLCPTEGNANLVAKGLERLQMGAERF